MPTFKNILVLHSASSTVLEQAVTFALASHAQLTVIDVTKKMASLTPFAKPGLPAVDVQQLVVQKMNEQLKQAVAGVLHEKLRIKTKVLVGSPSLEIIREVIRNKHDLVMLAAEGRGQMRERIFGSTALHLMRACPCPVLVVQPERSSQFGKVLAAVDIEPGDSTKSALNENIINLAHSIAAMQRAELHLVHAWTLFGEGIMEGVEGLDATDLQRIVQEEAKGRRALVEALAAELKIDSAALHVVKGDASDAIPRVVKSEAIDLLVMGTVCRTGIAGFLIGNTAETVLDRVDCSVLAIKPEGFVSPVKVDN